MGNVASLGAGWLADRYGGRMLVLAGGLLCCLGFAAVAGVGSYWQLVLLYSGVSAYGSRDRRGAQPLATVVNQWFIRRKAVADAVAEHGSFARGAGNHGAVAGVLRRSVRVAHGDLWTGGFVALLTALATVVIRSRPEDIGLLPDGELPATDGAGRGRGQRIEPAYSESDFTLRQAVATPAFWLMTAAVTLRIAAADALVINQIPMLVWKGIPEEQAAFFLSATFLVIIPLRFAMGWAQW